MNWIYLRKISCIFWLPQAPQQSLPRTVLLLLVPAPGKIWNYLLFVIIFSFFRDFTTCLLYKSALFFFKVIKNVVVFLVMVILISVTMTRRQISFSRSRMNRKTEIILLTLNVSFSVKSLMFFDNYCGLTRNLFPARNWLRRAFFLIKLVKGLISFSRSRMNRKTEIILSTLNVSIFLLIRSQNLV